MKTRSPWWRSMTPTPACSCRIFSGSPRWVAQGPSSGIASRSSAVPLPSCTVGTEQCREMVTAWECRSEPSGHHALLLPSAGGSSPRALGLSSAGSTQAFCSPGFSRDQETTCLSTGIPAASQLCNCLAAASCGSSSVSVIQSRMCRVLLPCPLL